MPSASESRRGSATRVEQHQDDAVRTDAERWSPRRHELLIVVDERLSLVRLVSHLTEYADRSMAQKGIAQARSAKCPQGSALRTMAREAPTLRLARSKSLPPGPTTARGVSWAPSKGMLGRHACVCELVNTELTSCASQLCGQRMPEV